MRASHDRRLARAAAALAVITSIVLAPLRTAAAQTASVPPPPSEAASLEDERRERTSIEDEATAAFDLYVGAGIALGVSAVLELTAVILVLDRSSEPLVGPDLGGLKTFEVIGAIGGVIGGIGIIALPIAIGLHVDSHSRRDALERCPRARLWITPNGLLVSGSF